MKLLFIFVAFVLNGINANQLLPGKGSVTPEHTRSCACQCGADSSSWDFVTTATAYLNCNVPTMLSMVGIIDKNQAALASSLCKIAESQTPARPSYLCLVEMRSGEIKKIVETGGLQAVVDKSDAICKHIGLGLNKVEKEGINMAIVKEFNPQ